MPKYRITNTTAFLRHPGFGLDLDGHYIGPNPTKPLIIELAVKPQVLEEWEDKKWVKIQDADDRTPVTKESMVTPGLAVNEAKGEEVIDKLNDELDEEEFDLGNAKEADLVGGPVPLQGIEQHPRAKVSLGSENENVGGGLSPIPGDRPVSVDESDKFTVRAPRIHGVGSVVKSS